MVSALLRFLIFNKASHFLDLFLAESTRRIKKDSDVLVLFHFIGYGGYFWIAVVGWGIINILFWLLPSHDVGRCDMIYLGNR